MMPYETLINPPAVASRAHHWPWLDVKAHLDKLDALGDDYVGRRLYLLHNPATGRTNGTTPSFFATMTIRPPAIVDRPHRHVSAAINYFFHGSGWSRVAGQRYEWGAGDLMLTAPGWAIHNHASGPDERVYELTVQDQPLPHRPRVPAVAGGPQEAGPGPRSRAGLRHQPQRRDRLVLSSTPPPSEEPCRRPSNP